MHTPGPWRPHTETGSPPFVTREGETSGWICQTVTWCGLDEAKDNARLIAAAPDLLDAAIIGFSYMQTMLGQVANLAPDDPKIAGALAEKEKVLAAIAKATGAT